MFSWVLHSIGGQIGTQNRIEPEYPFRLRIELTDVKIQEFVGHRDVCPPKVSSDAAVPTAEYVLVTVFCVLCCDVLSWNAGKQGPVYFSYRLSR